MTRVLISTFAALFQHEFVAEDRAGGGRARCLREDFKKVEPCGQDTLRSHGGRAPQVQRLGSVACARGARVRAARQGGGVLPGVFAPPEEARRPNF